MKRFDWTILLGVVIGLTAIVSAAWLENLSLGFLWHPTAALIVGGGTLGAVVVRRGGRGILKALYAVWNLQLRDESEESHKVELARLAWLSRSALSNGNKTFESYADKTEDILIAQGLTLLADSADSRQIEEVLKRRIAHEKSIELEEISTLEAAGAFAPTFGILGAVLGLISVLRVLDQPALLGAGISAAFVATIYGIGLANLIFFPIASRLRARKEKFIKRREEIAAVIIALGEKETPRAIINQFNLRQ